MTYEVVDKDLLNKDVVIISKRGSKHLYTEGKILAYDTKVVKVYLDKGFVVYLLWDNIDHIRFALPRKTYDNEVAEMIGKEQQ